MSEPKPFEAVVESNSRKTPVRVAFVTRRTSPQVRADSDQFVMTWPEGLFRVAVVCEVLAIVLVLMALFWDAPLEGLADPMQTPNPAKAPWYFLGLQELLHYFPPVVGGVLIPMLVVIALIVIPYFNVNVEAEGVWTRNRRKRLQVFSVVLLALIALLIAFEVWAVLAPTVIIGAEMLFAARESKQPGGFHRWLSSHPLSFWIMTWFLVTATLLTAIGTFFRGPGWSWVWPWSAY
jgi:hypothetical protein